MSDSADTVRCPGCVCVWIQRQPQPDSHQIHSGEETPLISSARRRDCDKLLFLTLVAFLIIGATIGTYLLLDESREISPEVFIFISRRSWGAELSTEDIPQLILPVSKVLFVETNSSACNLESQCAKIVRMLQKEHMEMYQKPDILYSFLVGGDGRIYEGRGWLHQPDYPDKYLDDFFTFGFIGDFLKDPPTRPQIAAAQSFLDFAVMKNKLTQCYDILVHHQPTRYLLDVASKIKNEASKGIYC